MNRRYMHSALSKPSKNRASSKKPRLAPATKDDFNLLARHLLQVSDIVFPPAPKPAEPIKTKVIGFSLVREES